MALNDTCAAWRPHVLSILRIMSGLLILQHGTAKMLGFPALQQFAKLQSFGMSWWGGVFELVCGALVVIGLLTRPAAFLLSGMCAVAYFYAHAARSFFPIANGGELAALYCFVFLYIAAAGPGPWSLDAIWKRK
jgi:putative oxidoreductase